MKLIDVLNEKNIIVTLKGNNKVEVVKELIDRLKENGSIDDSDTILKAVMEREKIMTTGVGRGVAIPHCKIKECSQFSIALGLHPEGINYESIDHLPAKIIFLLIGPEDNPGMHIRLLSRISRLISRDALKEELLKCSDSGEIFNILQNEEKKYFEIVS